MNELKLARLVRLALVPAFAAGVSMAALAQTPATTPAAANKPAAVANQATPNIAYRGLLASKVIGKSVRNAQGQDLGKISDLIVNMNTGDVRYAILEFDPSIFTREKLFAVPTTQLRMAADRDDIVYEMDKQRLENAATPRSTWDTTWRDPDFLGKLDKVWGVTQPAQGARAHRMSDLLDEDVQSRAGNKIGEVEDIVINMATQKVHYAVLEFDPSWAAPEKFYAFPLRSFDLTADRDDLVLDIDKARLQAMKSMPAKQMANLNDRAWVTDVDRYLIAVLPVTPVAMNAAPATLFANLDDDKNGWLDKAEVKDSADVDRNWNRFDKDSDGRISRQEFISNYTIEPGK